MNQSKQHDLDHEEHTGHAGHDEHQTAMPESHQDHAAHEAQPALQEEQHPMPASHEHAMHGTHEGEQAMHAGHEHAMHGAHEHDMTHVGHEAHEKAQPASALHAEHEGHEGMEAHQAHIDHTGHEGMFRQRFWVSLALSIPVLLYSPMIQEWLGFSMQAFPGSQWITPAFSVIVFLYGGLPFIQMAAPELRNRRPGMMTLITLAISVAFVYSLAALFLPSGDTFFWELVTLIDIMLLGHWLEMRSVRQASGALNELAKLMPDTAELVRADGS